MHFDTRLVEPFSFYKIVYIINHLYFFSDKIYENNTVDIYIKLHIYKYYSVF